MKKIIIRSMFMFLLTLSCVLSLYGCMKLARLERSAVGSREVLLSDGSIARVSPSVRVVSSSTVYAILGVGFGGIVFSVLGLLVTRTREEGSW